MWEGGKNRTKDGKLTIFGTFLTTSSLLYVKYKSIKAHESDVCVGEKVNTHAINNSINEY